MAKQKKPPYGLIFKALADHNPKPVAELHYRSPFELLVAVVLSAQATDVSVNKATDKLFKRANTPESIFALGVEGLKPYIKTIGLYNNKAKHIIALCDQLISSHDGVVPDNLSDLILLPGVGRKTANVVLNMAFSQPTIAVDTHVFRVARRLGLSDSNTVLGVEKDLCAHIPKPYLQDAHHWLILHGRYICKARKPLCDTCFLSVYCRYYHAL